MIYFAATFLMFTFFMGVVHLAKTKKRRVPVQSSCHSNQGCCSKR